MYHKDARCSLTKNIEDDTVEETHLKDIADTFWASDSKPIINITTGYLQSDWQKERRGDYLKKN